MSEATPAERRYDLCSQAVKNNPYPVFERMRQGAPVLTQRGLHDNLVMWFLTRYEDVEELLRDDERFVADGKPLKRVVVVKIDSVVQPQAG